MDENEKRPESIDEYISGFSPAIQERLVALRSLIRESAPDAVEKISWRMPTFWLHGNLVHFAAHKNHIGFYPGAGGIAAFQNELAGFKSSKGAVQFPYSEPLPGELVSRIVRFRVAENLKEAKGKPKKK